LGFCEFLYCCGVSYCEFRLYLYYVIVLTCKRLLLQIHKCLSCQWRWWWCWTVPWSPLRRSRRRWIFWTRDRSRFNRKFNLKKATKYIKMKRKKYWVFNFNFVAMENLFRTKFCRWFESYLIVFGLKEVSGFERNGQTISIFKQLFGRFTTLDSHFSLQINTVVSRFSNILK